MRFPLRLTADLTLALAARSLRINRNGSLVSPFLINSSTAAIAGPTSSPIVWIAGNEPLEFPETPSIANALAVAGRHVFLPTRGILLRRRIHEFQPSPRLHLTICFDGVEASHDTRAGRQGAFRDALESVRTARLSGFLLCAQLILHSQRAASELEKLHAELRQLDLDGFLISAAPRSTHSGEELLPTVAGLRRKLLTRRWALLSRLLDSVLPLAAPVVPTPAQTPPRSSRDFAVPMPPQNYEESVSAP